MAVRADWLLERGDPRGELIQLQLAREAAPDDRWLEVAEARHLAIHARALLGPLALHQSVAQLSWRRGYVVAATLRSVTQVDWYQGRRATVQPVFRLARAARDLGRLPAPEHLRAVRLEQPWSRVVVAHLAEALTALRPTGLHLEHLSLSAPGDPADGPVEVDERAVLDFDGLIVDCDASLVEMVRRALG